MKWKMIDTGASSALQNMALDSKFLSELDPASDMPILHLYDWSGPSATYGHFIDPGTLLSEDVFKDRSLDLAKRPTGGGLIFHTHDFAFSVLVPAGHDAFSVNTLENYAFVNHLVIEVIEHFIGYAASLSLLPHEPKARDIASGHFCMAKPTRYDVMLDGKKVGGGAQRRTRAGFLHQGTISLSLPEQDFLDRVLLPGTYVQMSMLEHTCCLLPESASSKDICEARQGLKNSFKKVCK